MWNSEVMPFFKGLESLVSDVCDFLEQLLVNHSLIPGIIQKGFAILDYQKNIYKRNSEDAFEAEVNGFKAICLNVGEVGSQNFDNIYDEKRHDVMVAFKWKKDKWGVSFYSTKDDVDCSEIAKSFGGGGHRQAAGSQILNLDFLLNQVKSKEEKHD